MTKEGRVSINTFLGNALESLAAKAVAELPLSFERSPDPPKGLTSPDFFRAEKPVTFIAVTSTPTRNTFQKKKWRYVHEVFSNKQYYSPRPFSINVQLSPPGALQPNDEKILAAIFDAEVRPPPGLLLDAIARLKSVYPKVDANARKAVEYLSNDPSINLLVDELTRLLKQTLRAPDEKQSRLWKCVQSGTTKEVRRSVPIIKIQQEATNLRAVCFGSVLIEPSRRSAFLSSIARGTRLAASDCQRLNATGVELNKCIAGFRPSPSFANTVRVYGENLLSQVISRIATSEEAAHIVADLRDESATRERVADVMRLLRGGSGCFVERVHDDFLLAANPIKPSRLAVLDYALLCAETSSTEIDRILSSTYSDFSSFNRVQCMISAKCQGRFSYTGPESRKIAERIFTYLKESTGVDSVADDEALQRVLESRRAALKLLGTEANPAQIVFESLCNDRKISCELVSLPSCIGDLGITGRVAKVERVYRLAGSAKHFIKVLSGYKGGFEHKAEELAARGWILRYRRAGAQWIRDNFVLGFLHEGDWDEPYLDLMLRSGWDWQYPLQDILCEASMSPEAMLRLFKHMK